MNERLSNPGPLGLMAFGMTTVLLNLHNAGLYGLGYCRNYGIQKREYLWHYSLLFFWVLLVNLGILIGTAGYGMVVN